MSHSQFRIDGKVALITGSSLGIGFAVARLFVEAGARCMITGRSPTPKVDVLISTSDSIVDFEARNVLDPATPDRLVQATVERFGQMTCWSTTPASRTAQPSRSSTARRLTRLFRQTLSKLSASLVPPCAR